MLTTEQTVKVVAANDGTHLTVLGDNITIKLTGEDTGGAFMMFENTNAPGHGIPMHVHRNEDETFYILEGEVEVQLGDKAITARAGDTVFLPRDVPHGFRITGDKPAHMLITVAPAGFENYFAEMSHIRADDPRAIERVLDTSARYRIEFLPPSY